MTRARKLARIMSYSTLQSYSPPKWTKPIRFKPNSYIKLALRPTPIHKWNLPGVPHGYQVWVKRDDMTGSTLGGNKVRKLEFLLADALEKGCDSVITCGAIESNHARATALAARQLGMQPHLLLKWSGDMAMPINTDGIGCSGNLLLDRVAGAKIMVTPNVSYDAKTGSNKSLEEMMLEYYEKLKTSGFNPYVVPMGGSNTIGSWGYIEAFQELLDDGVLENFDDIVLATGSGGTLSGLAVGNYLTGQKIKLHAVCVCNSAEYFYNFVDREFEEYGLSPDKDGKKLSSKDMVSIVEGYKGLGYAKNTEEELVNMVDIISKTAVPLDPVYTLKGVRGMLGELKDNPSSFSGHRILYIHTGGVFGLYAGTVDALLKQLPGTNQVSFYNNL